MARVFFVVFQVNPLFEDWARGLTESQNDLLVWTSRGSEWKNLGSAKVIAPFEKWSAAEFARALQFHLLNPAQVFHFVVQSVDPAPTAAHWLMMSWAKMFRKSVVVSFLGPIHDSPFWKMFANKSDFVTFSSRDLMLSAQKKDFLLAGKKSDVFWSHFPKVASGESLVGPFGEALYRKIGTFILLPWSRRTAPDLQLTKNFLAQGVFPVLLCEEGALDEARADFLALSGLSAKDCDELAAASEWIILTYAQLNLQQALDWRRRSVQGQTPVLISSHQLSVFPELCIPDQTGRVVSDVEADINWGQAFRRLAKAFDDMHLEARNPDSGVNSLTRIYRELELR